MREIQHRLFDFRRGEALTLLMLECSWFDGMILEGRMAKCAIWRRSSRRVLAEARSRTTPPGNVGACNFISPQVTPGKRRLRTAASRRRPTALDAAKRVDSSEMEQVAATRADEFWRLLLFADLFARERCGSMRADFVWG